MNCVVTHYPLSRELQQKICLLLGPNIIKLNLTELRQRSPAGMFFYLRSLHVDRVFIPVEDQNGSLLLPVLKLIAAAIPAKEIYVVENDLVLQSVSRMGAIFGLFALLKASFLSYQSVRKVRKEASKLICLERIKVIQPAGKRLLYLNANLWFGLKAGGSVGHISGVVNAFLKKGYNVHFASAGGRLMVDPEASYAQLIPSKHFGLPWEHNYYQFHFDVVKQLESLAEENQFDVIYQRLSIANYSGVILSRKFHVPLIIEYNGSEAWIARNWGKPLRQQVLAEQIEAINLQHAHLIVTISDVLKDELISRGVQPERIVTYPNCVDPEIFNPQRYTSVDRIALRQSYGIQPDDLVIGFIGTFGAWHGVEVLAKAIVLLIEQRLEWLKANKVRFLLVGDGAKMAEVREILGQYADGSRVILTGLVPQEKAPIHLAISDILVSPHVCNTDKSKFFGSPTKLFEYMAMEKVIIASDLDQIGNILSNAVRLNTREDAEQAAYNKRAAFLVEPGNVEQLTQAIQRLAENVNLRQVLGLNARLLALHHYTWECHVNAILKVAQQISMLRA